jgi:hypothetical protein
MMEEDLLQEMIRDRELSITFIKNKISDQDEKDIRLRKQQILITATVATNREEYRTELTALRQRYGEFLRQYHDAKGSLDTKRQQQQQHSDGGQQQQNGGTTTKGPGLQVYNEIMNAVDTNASSSLSGNAAAAMAGIDSSSNYVVRMQSQLCKAMHGMGIMETQLVLTREQTEIYKKKSKDVITDLVEEKSQVELKIVNELIVADTSRQEVETKRKTQHDSFFKEKYDLLEKIERQNEQAAANNEDDNDDDDDDEEEDNPEDKEELTGMVEHGKKEIERLERENEETATKLEELKIKAAIAQGQDVVDDIVTSIAEEFAEQETDDDDSDDDYD